MATDPHQSVEPAAACSSVARPVRGDAWSRGSSRSGHRPVAAGAARRLRRNKVALGFLVLFVVLVRACVLAPVYSHDIAHIGPNTNNVTGTINVGGKPENVVSSDGVPIGPTFTSHYFFGADTNGRDLAVRLLYGGRTSLIIGVDRDLDHHRLRHAVRAAVPATSRGVVDAVLRWLMELIWSFPPVILGVVVGTALAFGGHRPDQGQLDPASRP